MALAHSKITSQGQISVPVGVRRKLGIGPGSILEWDEDGDKIVVRRSARFSSADIHRALFPKNAPSSRTIDEMKVVYVGSSGNVMRAVDTNVLVRLLTRDNARQAVSAERFVELGAWVSILALADAVWVLSAVYERKASGFPIASCYKLLSRLATCRSARLIVT